MWRGIPFHGKQSRCQSPRHRSSHNWGGWEITFSFFSLVPFFLSFVHVLHVLCNYTFIWFSFSTSATCYFSVCNLCDSSLVFRFHCLILTSFVRHVLVCVRVCARESKQKVINCRWHTILRPRNIVVETIVPRSRYSYFMRACQPLVILSAFSSHFFMGTNNSAS